MAPTANFINYLILLLDTSPKKNYAKIVNLADGKSY